MSESLHLVYFSSNVQTFVDPHQTMAYPCTSIEPAKSTQALFAPLPVTEIALGPFLTMEFLDTR